MKRTLFGYLIIGIALLLAACGGSEEEVATPVPTTIATAAIAPTEAPQPTPTEAPITEAPLITEAAVDSIQVNILESFPVQVNVIARGTLPDSCTSLRDISTIQEGNAFRTTITAVRTAAAACAQTVSAFEETIALDVLDLPAGSYTVTVNGITGSFTLDVDNSAGAEPEPEVIGSISGIVWHDLCSVTPGDAETAAAPAAGCVASGDGAFTGNGILEEGEPGLPNITVLLGNGPCPSLGAGTALTDDSGAYSFSGLSAGTYCVAIDALAEENSDLLPGSWTFPETLLAENTVELAAGDSVTDINFGWDFEFLPVPEVDTSTCTNVIQFVEDINIPDDTVFAPGESFVKTWRLRNNGTCPWTTDYSLAFVGGDVMSATVNIPLTSTIVPGQTVDLSASFVAPAELGTYRSNWQVADAAGDPFGIGGLIEEAFWVQIVVAEPEAAPEPNSAVIGGVVWEDVCFFDSDGNPSAGCVETEEGSGFYVADGSLNFNEGRLADITVSLGAGACPETGVIAPEDLVATAVTDSAGLYRFTDLDAGTYCVAIDAFSAENVDLLIPGDWTWPARGVGRAGVLLDAGEELLEIDFGWQFQ